MIKNIVATLIIALWTVVCIYGTYHNTVRSAEVRPIEDGYEIEYHNTGQIYTYK